MKTGPVTKWECHRDIIEPFSFRYEAPVTVRNVRRCPSQFGRLLRYQSPGCEPPSWFRRLKVLASHLSAILPSMRITQSMHVVNPYINKTKGSASVL